MQNQRRKPVFEDKNYIHEGKVSRISPLHSSASGPFRSGPPQLEAPRKTGTEDPGREKSRHGLGKSLDFSRILELLKSEEVILLAIFVLLIIEGSDDLILIIALGYLIFFCK